MQIYLHEDLCPTRIDKQTTKVQQSRGKLAPHSQSQGSDHLMIWFITNQFVTLVQRLFFGPPRLVHVKSAHTLALQERVVRYFQPSSIL